MGVNFMLVNLVLTWTALLWACGIIIKLKFELKKYTTYEAVCSSGEEFTAAIEAGKTRILITDAKESS